MIALTYLRFRLLIGVRQLGRHPGRLLAALAVAAAALVALQVLADSPSAAESETIKIDASSSASFIGFVIAMALSLVLVIAPSSIRYPNHRADLAWLYPTPVGTAAIGLIQMMALTGRRLLVWFGSLVILEFGDLVLGGGFIAGPQFAGGVALLIVAASALSIGGSATRGVWLAQYSVQALGILLLLMLIVPITAGVVIDGGSFLTEVQTMPWPIKAVGFLVIGQASAASVVALGVVVAFGLCLVLMAGSVLREQLVLDAELWAELQDQQVQMQQTLRNPQPPLRGLTALRGSWALTWFELAQLRQARYHRWSWVILMAVSTFLGLVTPDLVPLLSYTAPFTVLVGAFSTGVVLHLRLGTFSLVPGYPVARIVAADLVQFVTSIAQLSAALFVACVFGDLLAIFPNLLLSAVGLTTLSFGARTAAAALSWRDGSTASAAFHAWLVLSVLAFLGFGVFAVPELLLGLGFGKIAVLLLSIAAALAAWAASAALLGARTEGRQPTSKTPTAADISTVTRERRSSPS